MRKPDDIERVFQAATKKRAEALMLGSGDSRLSPNTDLSSDGKNPGPQSACGNIRYVEAGGLMAYAFDRNKQYRSAG